MHRQLMLWPNRNAFYYILDRTSGEFLLAREFAMQTWAEGIDGRGRPQVLPNSAPSKEGTLIYPEVTGAANWWSPSYSPSTGLIYVMAYDGGQIFYLDEAEYTSGESFRAGHQERPLPRDQYRSVVRALEALTGKLKWEYEVYPKSTSGLLATAGDIVFGGGRRGLFFALDAFSGEELWNVRLGGHVHAAPVTYTVEGRQQVSIAAGRAVFTFESGEP